MDDDDRSLSGPVLAAAIGFSLIWIGMVVAICVLYRHKRKSQKRLAALRSQIEWSVTSVGSWYSQGSVTSAYSAASMR